MTQPALVHTPAPRAVVVVAMIFLALIIAPMVVIAPEKLAEPGTIVGLLVWLAFEFVLLSIYLRRVDVFLEGDQVRFVNARFPFSSREERVARARIRGVEAEYRPRGRSVRLVLRLDDDSSVPLTRSYFGRSARTDDDLSALRQLLGVDPASPRS